MWEVSNVPEALRTVIMVSILAKTRRVELGVAQLNHSEIPE